MPFIEQITKHVTKAVLALAESQKQLYDFFIRMSIHGIALKLTKMLLEDLMKGNLGIFPIDFHHLPKCL